MRERPPPWWPDGGEWPPRPGPGQHEWGRFGTRLKHLLVVVTVLMFLFSLGGGFLAARLMGGSVLGAVVVWLPAILGTVLAVALGRRTMRPVDGLVRAAGRVADGDYTARAPRGGPGPVRAATDSFNQMADRLEQADDQRRRLLADVGHELRTPLAVIRGEMEAMVDGVRPLDAGTVQSLLGDLAVMERLLGDLRSLSMAEAGQLALHVEAFDLPDLLADVVGDLVPQAEQSDVALVVGGLGGGVSDAVEVTADPVRVRGIILNLIVNAIRASPPGGTVAVGCATIGSDVHVQVTDDGPGIPDIDRERVFERFHKGADSGGTGLGLTISRGYARAHGGDLVVASTGEAGTTFTLTIPLSSGP